MLKFVPCGAGCFFGLICECINTYDLLRVLNKLTGRQSLFTFGVFYTVFMYILSPTLHLIVGKTSK